MIQLTSSPAKNLIASIINQALEDALMPERIKKKLYGKNYEIGINHHRIAARKYIYYSKTFDFHCGLLDIDYDDARAAFIKKIRAYDMQEDKKKKKKQIDMKNITAIILV